jgi:hypothetical protein
MIFDSSSRARFSVLLKELGLEFTWSDPDCGYKDDVLAYSGALGEFIGRLNPFLDELNAN